MYTVSKTDIFMEWFYSLKDPVVKNKIRLCLDRAGMGNLGDHHAIGEGVSEMRINYGPGYRLYYTIRERKIIILLCGGNKSSQRSDIQNAKQLNKEV